MECFKYLFFMLLFSNSISLLASTQHLQDAQKSAAQQAQLESMSFLQRSELQKQRKSINKPQTIDILKHAEVLQELKGLESRKNLATKTQSLNAYTQTEAYIRVIFNDFQSPITQYSLDYYFNRFLSDILPDATRNTYAAYRSVLTEIYENERKHASDYVFYHGHKQELGIIFDTYKEIFNFFNISASSSQMILMRDIMKPRTYKYNTANEFLDFWPTTQFYKDQVIARNKIIEKRPYLKDDLLYFGGWNDSKDPLRALILSANVSLFGNSDDKYANSLYYFVRSKSFSDTSNLLQSFFKIWKFDLKYLKELEDLLPLAAGGESGHLLQIFIPQDLINNMVYFCGAFGTPERDKLTDSFDEGKNRHTDALSILELYRNNPSKITTKSGQEYYEISLYQGYDLYFPETELTPSFIDTPNKFSIDSLQVRILLTPQLFDPASNIKIFRFSLNPPEHLAEYEQKLKTIVRNMLADWLNVPSNQAYFQKLNVPLTKLMEYIKSDKNIKQESTTNG